MDIQKDYSASRGRTSYIIENDDGQPVCRFPALSQAAVVYRFLTGAPQKERETAFALELLSKIDEKQATN